MNTIGADKARRTALMLALALGMTAGLAGCGGGNDDGKPVQIASLRLIGDYAIKTKTMFESVEFGGISGIDRAPDGSYWAISDDRGGERGTPRMYRLSLDFSDTAFKSVTIQKMVYLKDTNGQNFSSASRTVDPESIRVAPNGNLYISSEGNFSTDAAALFQPFVREMTTNGVFVREFETPKAFNYVDGTSSGGRNNKLFEALAVTPRGEVFAANEDALIQDGPITTLNAGSVIRVFQLDAKTGKSGAQYAYQLPKIPLDKAPTGTYAPDNGLSEMMAIGNNEFITVERAFADGIGNTVRLMHATIESDTTDVRNVKSLIGANYKPMKRELLLELPVTYKGVKIDNIEGITWGPNLANGNRSLVLVADNNFADNQVTQFLAFEVLPK